LDKKNFTILAFTPLRVWQSMLGRNPSSFSFI